MLALQVLKVLKVCKVFREYKDHMDQRDLKAHLVHPPLLEDLTLKFNIMTQELLPVILISRMTT
jgi:hypothetical protein